MKHILKKYEHERIRNCVSWDLTIYDDETEEIIEVNQMQYFQDEE